MSGRILLDTNIVIALFAGETAIQKRFAQAAAVFLPSIVLGELYFGAQKSGNVEANLMRIEEFAISSSVLTCDSETAKFYGAIKSALLAKGRPIPENDIWIAAIAQQHRLTLATRDAHFTQIEALNIETW
ncbi:MAG: VapC toxin family PIN domain ribonuclease [Anaerolineae bacterium]|nr:type II toxin-antitoxin system VapC family toxin [Anaerolineales bacterium]MCQ3979599.1 VapC toxin family PIN domain ribonuclease [Anaerolineae bacterium]